ncbi:traB domain-containing protein-like [Anopheles albimanus]|uniref:TraB n=1 Tax=Anopheles albimanus TaxID=7167 RepID=A0A182FAS4_ANOAL|nr:traB domain-containing protein-like [Anopheles albimanus]XP_035778802.1 traB domain-containing protein-like [Anopheles albimanus]
MSSPFSSSSEYNSALDTTLNSTLDSSKLDTSDNDSEDVSLLTGDWNGTLRARQSKPSPESTLQFLDSLRNNNLNRQQSPTAGSGSIGDASSSNNNTSNALNTTASTLSLDLSASDTANNVTLSFVSSSEEDDTEPTGVKPHPSPADASLNMSQSSDTSDTVTTGGGERDSRDTTANVSLIPIESVATTNGGSGDPLIPVYGSLEEFDRHLPETVTVLTTPDGAKVYLVGTAHFSESSQRDVSLVMRNVQPNVVMLELCPSRIHILRHDEQTLLEEAKNMNLAKMRTIIQTNGSINGLFYILLLSMNAKFTKKLGMAPGGEFRCAVREAQRIPNCIIQLGDRQIKVTLQRALRGLSVWQTLKLIPKLLFMDDITPEEVEQCKKKDLLEEIMLEMAEEFPAFGRVFVEERDLYLCHSLQMAALPIRQPDGTLEPVRVVAVVGIGHAAGIAKHWGKVSAESIHAIAHIPPASLGHRVLKYTVKYGLLGLAGYGIFRFARARFA